MMVFALQKHAIGVGYGVALASLTNWEAIVPSGTVRFNPVKSWGNYSPGILRKNSLGRVVTIGDPSTRWEWTGVYNKQFRYVMTTYCNSGYDGLVTIYTITDTPQTYARFNAILTLPQLTELDWRGRATRTVRLEFTRMEAL
jgi:hypothetical protein